MVSAICAAFPSISTTLAHRDTDEVSENLKKVGLSVVQDETFYVEPKKEEA